MPATLDPDVSHEELEAIRAMELEQGFSPDALVDPSMDIVRGMGDSEINTEFEGIINNSFPGSIATSGEVQIRPGTSVEVHNVSERNETNRADVSAISGFMGEMRAWLIGATPDRIPPELRQTREDRRF